MAQNLPVFLRNQRQGKRLCRAKRIDNLPFLLVAISNRAKSRLCHLTDFGGVLWPFLADMHSASLHRLLAPNAKFFTPVAPDMTGNAKTASGFRLVAKLFGFRVELLFPLIVVV